MYEITSIVILRLMVVGEMGKGPRGKEEAYTQTELYLLQPQQKI